MKRTILWVMVVALLAAGCSAAATPAPVMKSDVSSAPAAQGAPLALDQNRNLAAPATEAKSPSTASGSGAADRIVIKTANLEIVVSDPGTSMDTISKMADRMGGFVVTSNIYKTTTSNGVEIPEASITIRVPAEKLNDALIEIKTQVKSPQEDILSENITGQDVTQEYTDLQSRLSNYEQTETQLREIMASATKTEDVMTVFNQLTQVREQIEILKGQIKYYETSANFSAISVVLKAQASVQPLSIGGWQPVGVARDAVQALLNTLRFLANVIIWLIIFFLPLALVIFFPLRLLWVLFRRWRAKHKINRSTPPQTPTPPAAK
jgi:hypothetical protein